MYTRTLFLWAVAVAFGLSYGEGFANPNHGGAHPNPKAHPPANKGGTANAKSFTPPSKSGANTTTNPATGTGTKPQVVSFPHDTVGTQHDARKDTIEHKNHEGRREKELHEKEVANERARIARLDAELDRLLHLPPEEHHRHDTLKNKNGNANNSNQSQYGQQQPYQQQQYGQQGSSSQPGGASGGQESGQPQFAQGQDASGTEPARPGMASAAFHQAERLLLAALHQLEEAFSKDGEHRHHHLAEAHRLLEEAARSSEVAAHVMRTYEHPRMEAAPNQPRS